MLINNAGILTAGNKPPTTSCVIPPSVQLHRRNQPLIWLFRTFEELETDLRTNLFGVIDTTQALLPLLRAGHGKKVWTVSSILGSVGGPLSDTTAAATCGFSTWSNQARRETDQRNPPDSISKAALNMYIRKIGAELAGEQFTVLAFHPGYVKTDMNDGLGNIFKEESVEKSCVTLVLSCHILHPELMAFLNSGIRLKTLQSKTSADAGTLWNYSGEPILW